MDFLDPPTEDFSSRPAIYKKEEPLGIPSVPANYDFAPLTTIQTGFVEQPGEYTGGRSIELAENQRVVLEEEPQIMLMSVPVPSSEPSLVRKEPLTWFNSELPHYIPNGADISGGGGGSQSLDQVLAVGNNAGAYNIDMNGRQLLSLAAIQAKPGDDFNIINATDDVNLAGAFVNLTAGQDVNINATRMAMGNSKIVNLGNPTQAQDAATKAYVDASGAKNWSLFPAISDVNIAGQQMNDVQFINAPVANDNPVFIYNPNNLGYSNPLFNALVVAGGDNRADISGNGVGIATQKNITRGIIDYGAGESVGSFATFGKDTADNDIPYARVVGVATDPTAGTTLGRMNLGVRSGATNLIIAQLDASGNELSIQGNSGTRLNMNSKKLVNVPTPTTSTDAANKNYVDVSGGQSWSQYRATQNVDMSGFDISGVANIRGSAAAAGKITMPAGLLDLSGAGATLTLGSNAIYNRVVAAGGAPAGLSVNDPFTAGDATQTAYHFATVGTTQTSALFTMCRKGQFTNMFGVQGTSANNTFVIGSQTANTDFEIRKNVGIAPANLTGGTLLAQFNRNGQVSMPLLSNATTANSLYYNTTNGLLTYGTAPGANNWATFPATQNVDMSGFALTRVGGISNATGSVNITGNDVNIDCTGLTSILNIGSQLGTLITSVGAVDITAGGTTAINSTGNITIGSLGTTSIENFNLSNSVLTKVPATADLQLNNIATIQNTAANIDISAAEVNVNKFIFGGSNMSAPGATRLFLDDVAAINNDAVGGTIDITATTVRANSFQFAGAGGNIMTTNAGNLELNDIATLNKDSGPGEIAAYKTIVGTLSNVANPVAFKTAVNTNSGTPIGFYANAVSTSDPGETAVGAYIAGTEANNTNGNAVGLSVQTVLGGTGVGNTATGVEVWGSMTGTTKRGFWEHSASANVVNTFTHAVGIGSDPNSSYLLDVSGGNARITNTAANPTSLVLENVEGGASANVLRIYKNSATPAANDAVANIQMGGNNSSAAYHTYASIQGAIQNATAGSEAGEMRLRATVNSTSTDFIHIDGSNNIVNINPNLNATMQFTMEDASGFNLITADASARNVMFRNYPQRYIYDINGNYLLTLPNAFNVIRILAFGAGGGGGSGRKGPSSCFGGGAGAGGNGVELWFDRRELLPDASGSISLYITVGAGGAGGTAVSTAATNGNNGSAGGQTYINLDAYGAGGARQLYYQILGGNGGSGGTNAAGTGGTAATFSGDRNVGSAGRSGASSSITGQPARNTTALLYNGSIYSQTGGSGAGGGIDAAGTTQYQGGTFVSPCGQKYNGLGANVAKEGAAGTAGGTPGGAGGIVSFDQLTTAAVRPLAGMCSIMAGGGASIGGAGGTGGSWTAGTAGSRGDGGGGGGATGNAGSVPSGAGGRGADGFVYITVW